MSEISATMAGTAEFQLGGIPIADPVYLVDPSSGNPLSPASSSTATLSSVASATSTGVLLAANVARKGVVIYNESTAILYVACALTTTTSAYTIQIAANASWSLPLVYTGVISGLWSAVNGNARITEFS